MTKPNLVGSLCVMIAASAGCAGADDPADGYGDELELGALIAVTRPAGNLQSGVVELASDAGLLAAVTSHDTTYIHDQSQGAWYFKSGNYLLGIESFTQFHQGLDQWVDFGSGDKVAPAQARVVGHNFHGQGWVLPSNGQWSVRANSVWVIGTNSGIFGMGGAPQGLPLGTEVFGSMQAYGGTLSTPYLEFDGSTDDDSARIRAAFSFNASTLLGGHSAGSSVARRIGLDVGLTRLWLYGTPNYGRSNGAYVKTETAASRTMRAEVINNNSDPVTNVLTHPWSLVSLAWGTAKCHDYSRWDYQKTSPVSVVCP
ncbi:MAG TPA: hypothetical protein VN253_29915 [Kofleriaceae bacterium]|nr:hypothetical protein [Kofleriaceae bacterium]